MSTDVGCFEHAKNQNTDHQAHHLHHIHHEHSHEHHTHHAHHGTTHQVEHAFPSPHPDSQKSPSLALFDAAYATAHGIPHREPIGGSKPHELPTLNQYYIKNAFFNEPDCLPPPNGQFGQPRPWIPAQTVPPYSGWNGFNGTNGYNGWNGFNGANGYNGWNAFNGTNGYNGWNAFNGTNGYNGWNGFNGANGYNGWNGFNGTNGYNGWNGFNGANGYNGWNGFNGTNGYNSWNGFNGANGYDGWNGFNGANGYNGWNGFNGADELTGWQNALEYMPSSAPRIYPPTFPVYASSGSGSWNYPVFHHRQRGRFAISLRV